jgi:hypothetical protein
VALLAVHGCRAPGAVRSVEPDARRRGESAQHIAVAMVRRDDDRRRGANARRARYVHTGAAAQKCLHHRCVAAPRRDGEGRNPRRSSAVRFRTPLHRAEQRTAVCASAVRVCTSAQKQVSSLYVPTERREEERRPLPIVDVSTSIHEQLRCVSEAALRGDVEWCRTVASARCVDVGTAPNEHNNAARVPFERRDERRRRAAARALNVEVSTAAREGSKDLIVTAPRCDYGRRNTAVGRARADVDTKTRQHL